MANEKTGRRGALALVGSGEYTPAMRDTDRALLETVGGPGGARVVVLPTAAGREHPSSPARWALMGVEHFSGLGAQVEAALILNREDAEDPRWLPMLEAATFVYFSGGDPSHVIETMRGTPSWEVIERRHAEEGAVLAGCSAGAMAFGGWSPHIRGLRSGGPLELVPALGIEPHVIVMPHFDRMGRWIPAPLMKRLLDRVPEGAVLLGVDEDTALVRLHEGAPWTVFGRQSVTVFDRSAPGGKRVYASGQEVALGFDDGRRTNDDRR